jgi:hypothetical protein
MTDVLALQELSDDTATDAPKSSVSFFLCG